VEAAKHEGERAAADKLARELAAAEKGREALARRLRLAPEVVREGWAMAARSLSELCKDLVTWKLGQGVPDTGVRLSLLALLADEWPDLSLVARVFRVPLVRTRSSGSVGSHSSGGATAAARMVGGSFSDSATDEPLTRSRSGTGVGASMDFDFDVGFDFNGSEFHGGSEFSALAFGESGGFSRLRSAGSGDSEDGGFGVGSLDEGSDGGGGGGGIGGSFGDGGSMDFEDSDMVDDIGGNDFGEDHEEEQRDAAVTLDIARELARELTRSLPSRSPSCVALADVIPRLSGQPSSTATAATSTPARSAGDVSTGL